MVARDLTYVPYRELERLRDEPAFADLCRLNVLYMIMRAGSGHIGSSFSAMDIVAWLCRNRPGATYFSSKGHDVPALYSVLLGLGAIDFDKMRGFRRIGGLPGHPDIASVPNIVTNTGSLGMGISKAKGMVLANRLRGVDRDVVVLTGDGELQEGQFWESLQPAANLRMGELTVIVDHNKLQSDTWVDRVSSLGRLQERVAACGWRVARCDGHDTAALAAALAQLDGAGDVPRMLIADTVKGKGVSFMEADTADELYRFHSGAPSYDDYCRAVDELLARVPDVAVATEPYEPARPAQSPQRLIAAYEAALVEAAKRDASVVALDADLMLDCGLREFYHRFPERFFECGIAEQDMVSQAGGMALSGLLPVVHSFACFLSARPNEQIYNNATERTKIVYVGSLAGLVPAGPGHSHQAVRDISTMAAVPGLIALEPCTEAEVALAVDYCVRDAPASTYLRLVSVPWPVPFELPARDRLELGKGVAVRDGDAAVVFGYGPVLLSAAYAAAEMLSAEHGIELRVVDLPWLNRVDRDWLLDVIGDAPVVVALDNHYVVGGQGDLLCAELAQAGRTSSTRVVKIGVDRIPTCGLNHEALRDHRLDADGIAARILTTLTKD